VKLDKLSKYKLCGGHIKNIIFASARRALAKQREHLLMEDFEVSVKRELKGLKAFQRDEEYGEDFEADSIGGEVGEGMSRNRDCRIEKTFIEDEEPGEK